MSAITRDQALAALSRHVGRANGVTARELVREIMGPLFAPADTAALQRSLREAIVELRRDGHHVCAHPSSGYFLAANDRELDETCLYLYGRALCSLEQISAMKRVSLPDLKGQLRLPS